MEYDNGCIPDFPNFVEIHRNNLKIKELLGKGEFGEVFIDLIHNFFLIPLNSAYHLRGFLDW